MAGYGWILAAAGATLLVLLIGALWLVSRRLGAARLGRARDLFHRRREYLEAKFFDLAAQSGKPRGLEWVGCDFEDDVAYARDRATGDLVALVAITIRFAAIAGGGMEDVEAVGNLRAATAVFRYRQGAWSTDGRAIFNLSPAQTIDHFNKTLEKVTEDES